MGTVVNTTKQVMFCHFEVTGTCTPVKTGIVQPENSTVLTHVTQLFIHVIAMSFSDA